MQTCPVEILEYISSLSCNDGGLTGRSLSATSKYIRQASSSHRFQSIACRHAGQTIAFASILESTPLRLRSVRHLLVCSYFSDLDKMTISTQDEVPTGKKLTSWKKPCPPVQDTLRLYKPYEAFTSQQTLAQKVRSAIIRILAITAPTLVTLSFHQTIFLEDLPYSHFPALVELSINQAWPGPTGMLEVKALKCLSTFPSLRRLILTAFERLEDAAQFVDNIRRIAPSLTHLGIPAFCALPVVAKLLLDMTHSSSAVTSFPHTLEVLLLHGIESRIWEFQTAWESHGKHLVVQSGLYVFPSEEDGARWENAWVDGISGGEGHWSRNCAASAPEHFSRR